MVKQAKIGGETGEYSGDTIDLPSRHVKDSKHAADDSRSSRHAGDDLELRRERSKLEEGGWRRMQI